MGFLIAGPPVVTVSPNITSLIAVHRLTEQGVVKAGNEILASAQAIAPKLTGDLANSGSFTLDDSGVGHVVFGGGVVDYAAYVEFGTIDTPTFAFLRRGAEAAGYDV